MRRLLLSLCLAVLAADPAAAWYLEGYHPDRARILGIPQNDPAASQVRPEWMEDYNQQLRHGDDPLLMQELRHRRLLQKLRRQLRERRRACPARYTMGCR